AAGRAAADARGNRQAAWRTPARVPAGCDRSAAGHRAMTPRPGGPETGTDVGAPAILTSAVVIGTGLIGTSSALAPCERGGTVGGGGGARVAEGHRPGGAPPGRRYRGRKGAARAADSGGTGPGSGGTGPGSGGTGPGIGGAGASAGGAWAGTGGAGAS